MNKCDFCICKTCAIAYYNGGAQDAEIAGFVKEHQISME